MRNENKKKPYNESKKKPYNVLFVGTANCVRSIMAEAILNRSGQGKFRAYSAGSHPTDQVHPYVVNLLRKLHYDVAGLRPKSWREFLGQDAPKLDFVFTVCGTAAKETYPVWPSQPLMAHWAVPDPVEATGSEAEVRFAFADSLRMLTNRIDIFVSLPLYSLDQLTMQKQIDAIGKAEDADAKPAPAA